MAIEGYNQNGVPIRAVVRHDPKTGKPIRSRIGIIVHYTSGTATDNIERIEVLNDDSPLEEQLKSKELNNQRISDVYMYTSKEDVVANRDIIYNIYREDDMYLLEDLYHEEDFTALYHNDIYVAWDYTYKGITRTRITKLVASRPINVQVKSHRMKNAYLCVSELDAEFVKRRWDARRSMGLPPIR